mgnify:CR=1 FL=1
MNKKQIIQSFLINKKQEFFFETYLETLKEYNVHTNVVGKSTLEDPWTKHFLDSLQVSSFVENKTTSIIDMGTGAGFPGLVLSIMGYSDVTLVDSSSKKIKFLGKVKKKLNLNTKIILGRVEKQSNRKFDIVTCRALASLEKLISYSQKFIKKNTVLIFLKGKTVNEEIEQAQQQWSFQFEKHQSISDSRGSIITIRDSKKIK